MSGYWFTNFFTWGDNIGILTIISIILVTFSIILILLSKTIYVYNQKLKNNYKIQKGEITYSDLDKPGKPFFSKRYRITGKPDYIVKRNKSYIPVEVKTGKYNKPLKNHIFQLAGYCHLLEENFGGFVPYGILVYGNNNSYTIPFDPKTRFELESTLKNMRNIMRTKSINRNHNEVYKCKNCSMRLYCNNKLI
ncbi:hypothetical protein AYK24_05705 [Thermoplasmatales archaeon SG8-52-4]|nr:MAG: hypothetical protein AYK24_05705 [Thermoplasmatales archaeon SG8-52-4]